MKPTDQNSAFYFIEDSYGDTTSYNLEYGKAWGAKVDANIGVVKATAGYTVFKDGQEVDYLSGDSEFVGKQKDNKIWNVGVAFDVVKELILTADYLKSNTEMADPYEDKFDGDDGYIIGLNYKGAKANEPGTYGVYANFYDQARGTVIAHTMNGFYGNNGFKGYMIGANYTFAKNIVGAIEWYDLESKGLFDYVPKQDMETLWAQVVFTF